MSPPHRSPRLPTTAIACATAWLLLTQFLIGAVTHADDEPASPRSEEPSVLVRLQPMAPVDAADAVARDHGVSVLGPVEGTGFVLFSTGRRTVDDVADELARDGRVETAEANPVRQVAAVPNDPLYAGSQAQSLGLLRLPEAWDLTTGADDLVLAVVDSGVAAGHPDMAGRILPGRDFVEDDNDPDDDLGHGTQVATVAAANGDDHAGMAGVFWRGKILPVKVIDGQGKTTDASVAAGIRWAVDHGADVINLSFGGPQAPTTIVKEAIQYAQGRDAVIVAAAGNSGRTSPIYPAAVDGVVAVAATDQQGLLADFSDSGSWVDLAAPGVGLSAGARDGSYGIVEGTSFAAPVVAGVAMLTRARFPNDTADQIVHRLQFGATDTGPLGPDDIYGSGIVNAAGALGAATRRLPVAPALLDHEPDNTPDRATPLAIGASATGHLAPERDVDWFAVDVTAPRRHTFTVAPAGTGTDVAAIVGIYDPQLQLLKQVAADRNGKAQIELYTSTAGRYSVRILTMTTGTDPYSVTVRSVDGPATTQFDPWNVAGYTDLIGSAAAVIADLNGDGRNDILASGARPPDGLDHNELVLMPRPGDQYVVNKIPTAGAGSVDDFGLAVSDVDGDGDDDAVLATSGGLELYHQTNGALQGVALVPQPGPVTQVEAGDLNGDGLDDLAMARAGAGISVLLNEGNAVFGAPVEIGSARVAEIEVADIDGDGRQDVAALECDPTCRSVAVYRTSGTTFERASAAIAPGATCGSSGALGVGNLIGDQRLEIFAACTGIRMVQLLTTDATGTFVRRAALDPGSVTDVDALEAADIDGDGRDDIVAVHHYDEHPHVLWLDPDGTLGETFDLGKISQSEHGPKGLAVGDLNHDGRADLVITNNRGFDWIPLRAIIPGAVPYGQMWVRDMLPAPGATDVPVGTTPTVRFAPPINPGSIDPSSVRLTDAVTGAAIPTTVTFDGPSNSVIIRPAGPLSPGGTYEVNLVGVNGMTSAFLPDVQCCYRFAVRADNTVPAQPVGGSGRPPTGDVPFGPAQTRSGYWMLAGDGAVYRFGDSPALGDTLPGAVDLEPTPSGRGYWTLTRSGVVSAFGDATWLGSVNLAGLGRGEEPASLSSTPSGKGYWVFTNRGRVIAFGDAQHLGDVSTVKLNGPVLGSVATPTGKGYYMVASDGGIFTFGDAAFLGSMGSTKLNAPVQSLVPDSDGKGYWLVASDGGIFAFDAPFKGSLGDVKLNKPVVGMVRYGDGYLMVGADGGIFTFSSLPFSGSLGDKPPSSPVVAVAALP